MSEKQLHESKRGLSWPLRTDFAVRSCEMEARSVPISVTPNIRSKPAGNGDGSGGTSLHLTPGDLDRSNRWDDSHSVLVGHCEGNDLWLTSIEKSNHLVVVTKPGNAGGAKEMTS